MKVLFISSGNIAEGISPIVKNQGKSLEYAGCEIEYFVIKGKGILAYIKHINILHKHIKNNFYDIFHAHYSASAIVASLAGCNPLVVSLMGSETKSGLAWKYIIHFFNLCRWSDIIVKSSAMQKEIGIKSSKIIPNGVDLNKIKPVNNFSSGLEKGIILFAADPKRYVKNYKLAQKAVSKLQNTGIILKIVHSKPFEEIIHEIKNSAVCLLTSYWEGSPNIIKEAMACNCPIVTTDVGDVRWVIGDTEGCFITTFEPEDVAEKIKAALAFGKRTNGRKRIIKLGLDSDTVAKKNNTGIYRSIKKEKKELVN